MKATTEHGELRVVLGALRQLLAILSTAAGLLLTPLNYISLQPGEMA